jgi:hypothetical protein
MAIRYEFGNEKINTRSVPLYPISNEKYDAATIDAVRKLGSFDSYIGICGGGNQNLFWAGITGVKEMVVVDKEREQLKHFGKIVRLYNESESGEAYTKALIDMSHESVASKIAIGKLVRNGKPHPVLEKPDLKELNVTGSQKDVADYVCSVELEGRYFLYFSNALFHHNFVRPMRSMEILNVVLSAREFLDGSTVLMMINGYDSDKVDMSAPDRAMVLSKESGKFRVVYDGDQRLTGKLCTVEEIVCGNEQFIRGLMLEAAWDHIGEIRRRLTQGEFETIQNFVKTLHR